MKERWQPVERGLPGEPTQMRRRSRARLDEEGDVGEFGRREAGSEEVEGGESGGQQPVVSLAGPAGEMMGVSYSFTRHAANIVVYSLVSFPHYHTAQNRPLTDRFAVALSSLSPSSLADTPFPSLSLSLCGSKRVFDDGTIASVYDAALALRSCNGSPANSIAFSHWLMRPCRRGADESSSQGRMIFCAASLRPRLSHGVRHRSLH